MISTQKIREKQTILISSSRKSCGYHCIGCLSNYCFIVSTAKMIPTIPSFNKEYTLRHINNIFYPFEEFDQVHYSIRQKMRRKITHRQMLKFSSCRERKELSKTTSSFIFCRINKTKYLPLKYLHAYLYLDASILLHAEIFTYVS
jgi:hypothetical protein